MEMTVCKICVLNPLKENVFLNTGNLDQCSTKDINYITKENNFTRLCLCHFQVRKVSSHLLVRVWVAQ